MTDIYSLKDNNNNLIYPLSHEKAIKCSDGTMLDAKLEQISNSISNGSTGDSTTVEVTKDITVAIEGNTTIPSTASQQEVLVEFTSGSGSSGSNNVPTFTNLITADTTLQKTGVTTTTVNANELEYSCVGQDKSGYFRFTVSNLTANHKYYCSLWAKSTTAFPISIISTRVGNTTTDYARFSSINTYTSGTWYIGFDTGTKNSSDTYAFKKPLLIDLTELYGEGNEPTKEEFEAVLGDAWCLGTYSPSSSPLPSADFIINSYKSDDSLLDTFNSNSDTNIIIIGGGYVNVSGNSIPQTITLKNVTYTEQQASGGSSVTTREFVGIKWACIGDSLTDSSINANTKYHKLIANKTGITVQELAKGGTGYTAGYANNDTFYDRIANIDADTDIVTLFGSVNDWKNNQHNSLCKQIGTASDTYDDSKTVIENTFCANLNKTFDALFTKVPTAQVIVFGAMPYYGVNQTYFGNARQALIDVCANRHITYVDMFDATGFYRIMNNADYAAAYTTDFKGTNYDSQTSFGHPNNAAHEKIIAPLFLAELRKHLP